MNLKDIEFIEKELNTKLPKHYKDFIANHQALILKLRGLLVHDQDYIQFSTDAKWVVEHNQTCELPRREGYCRGKISIGTDGCGNDSLISLSNDDEHVYFMDHESVSEFFDEEIDDFKFDHKDFEKFENLEAFVKFYIKIEEGTLN